MPPRDPSFDLDKAIETMPETHLHCRDYGHAWRPFTARYVPAERAYEQSLRCSRCKAQRHRLLDSHGSVIRSGYDYPDGYLVQGLGRLTGDDRGLVRLASIRADIERKGGRVDDNEGAA